MPAPEVWEVIPDHPDYLISSTGRVYNRRTERLMAESKTMQGDLKVTLSTDGERETRSVRVLVAEAFVPKPAIHHADNPSSYPDTVIVLDNKKSNLDPTNLAWRPAWFAQKYARQFQPAYPQEYYTRRIYNAQTKAIYDSILEAGIREGLLFADVLKSASTGLPIYPYGHTYSFV